MPHPTAYRTVQIDGLSIFYREAGPKNAPTILLLHGLPSSSRMFEPLLERLANNYHLIAPDYPGFGHSDWPDPKKFAYTFDNIASVMDDFTQTLFGTDIGAAGMEDQAELVSDIVPRSVASHGDATVHGESNESEKNCSKYTAFYGDSCGKQSSRDYY